MANLVKSEKPIDRWLGIGGIAVAIILYLMPKTPTIVIGSLLLMFALLAHPLWNFWWIEAKLWRKATATLLLIVVLCYVGHVAWPPEYANSQPHLLMAFGRWWRGSHGRWFDRLLGAICTLAALFVSLMVAVAVKAFRSGIARPNAAKGFLDYKLQTEQAFVELPRILGRFTSLMDEVSRSVDTLTADFSRASGSTIKALAASRAAAIRINNYSAQMARVQSKFEKQSRLLSEGLCGWSAWIKEQQPSRTALSVYADGLRHMKMATDTAIETMRSSIVATIGAKGAFAVLDAALDRQIAIRNAVVKCCLDISNASGVALAVFDGLPMPPQAPCIEGAQPGAV